MHSVHIVIQKSVTVFSLTTVCKHHLIVLHATAEFSSSVFYMAKQPCS